MHSSKESLECTGDVECRDTAQAKNPRDAKLFISVC